MAEEKAPAAEFKPYVPDSKDAGLVAYGDFMKARLPNVDPANFAAGYGYMVAQALVVVLEQCKNDLSRANIMAQAANLKNVPLSMLLPGITLNTSPTDYRPIKDGYMVEFRDNQLVVISELLRGSAITVVRNAVSASTPCSVERR